MLPKCRVLLVEDSPDSAILVNHFLSASKIAEFHLVTAGSLQAAREALSGQHFDAILLDLNLPDSRGIETFGRVRESARGATIVILTAVEDEETATTAIGHGAADYLIKGEVGGEGLARRIRFAIERSRAAAPVEPAPAGRMTVLLGAKGGPGVSTLAINLSAELSRVNRNVILLELRSHGGTLAAMLGISPPVTLDGLAEMGGPNAVESSLSRLPFGTRAITASADAEPPGGTWEPAAVDCLLQKLAGLADHVVVDTTLAQSQLAKAAVARASFTALVLEREPVSVSLGGHLAATLAAWSGRPACVGAVLVNHMPFLDAVPLPAVRAELNCGIVSVLPPAREVIQSYRRYGPIVLAQPEAPVSLAFKELAARLDQSPVQFLGIGQRA